MWWGGMVALSLLICNELSVNFSLATFPKTFLTHIGGRRRFWNLGSLRGCNLSSWVNTRVSFRWLPAPLCKNQHWNGMVNVTEPLSDTCKGFSLPSLFGKCAYTRTCTQLGQTTEQCLAASSAQDGHKEL